jgi:hypothetical protein
MAGDPATSGEGGAPSPGGGKGNGGTNGIAGGEAPGGEAGAGDQSGGESGAPCVPSTYAEVCADGACGNHDAGCGITYTCNICDGGSCAWCSESERCGDDGYCAVPECDCGGSECGRLTGCSGNPLCGENSGKCGTSEICMGSPGVLGQGSGLYCQVPSGAVCEPHIPGQSETCCASKGVGCTIGYSYCKDLIYSVNLDTGESCGSCMTGEIRHDCGPGWFVEYPM